MDEIITVFEVATPEELLELTGEDDEDFYDELRDRALKFPDMNNELFAFLHFIRDEREKAEEYAKKIVEPARCYTNLATLCFHWGYKEKAKEYAEKLTEKERRKDLLELINSL